MKDNQAKYPQLRFKGFTDPWEKRSLDEITTKTKSYSLSRDVERDHETGYRYIHYGDIHTGVADIVTEHTNLPNIEPANYDELRVNDLVVADASEDYQGIAEPAVVVGLPTQHLVAGLHTIALRPSSASSLYLYYLLHTESFKHFGYQTGTGLKVFGISWSNLSKFTFMIPSRPEQEKIIKLIESVDNLTSDNQRKLAKLKELKQGYLQKLFPKNGSKFPQLRFAGFADAWEECKLGDITTWTKGQGLSKEYLNNERYGSEAVHYADLYKFSPVMQEVIHWTNSDDGRIIPDNSLLFPASDVTPVGLARTSTLRLSGVKAGGDVIIGQLSERINSSFMSYQINANSKKILPLITGTTVKHVQAKSLATMSVTITNMAEQTAISGLFERIDNLIALHQRKLEKLQELKKGYLQKMFC